MARFIHEWSDACQVEVTEWSADEYATAGKTPVLNQANATLPEHVYDKSMSWQERADWYAGVKGVDDAASLVTHGWKAGADRLASVVSDVVPPQSQTRRRKPAWRDAGDTLDVDRAMAGDMEPWRMAVRQITAGPQHIELNVHLGGAYYRSGDALFWLAAPAIVLTDLLEQAGFSVRLVGCNFGHANRGAEGLYNHTVVVKDYSEPLRIDLAAAVLAHAGTWRTLGFLAMVTHSHLTYNTGFGINNVSGGLSEIKPLLTKAGAWHDGSVALNDCYTQIEAVAEVNRVLASLASG